MDKLSKKSRESSEVQPPKSISVDRRVRNAILKLQGSKGISLQELKKYLRDEKNLDIAALNDEIKSALKAGIDKGLLTRENGNYKVTGAAKRRLSKPKGGRSRSRKKSSGRKRSRSKSKGAIGSRAMENHGEGSVFIFFDQGPKEGSR